LICPAALRAASKTLIVPITFTKRAQAWIGAASRHLQTRKMNQVRHRKPVDDGRECVGFVMSPVTR